MIAVRLLVDTAEEARALELEIDESLPASALFESLAPKLGREAGSFGLHSPRLDEPIHPSVPLHEYRLRSGDRLILTDSPPGGPPIRGAAWALRVISGAAEGALIPLPLGVSVLGRDLEGLSLLDSSISRRHALLHASSDSLSIQDAGSTNGTEVNGTPVDRDVALDIGDRIGVGESTLEVFRPRSIHTPSHVSYDDGVLSVNRPPRVVKTTPARIIDLEAPPPTPTRRRLPLITSLIPLALGAVMFFIMGANPMYLLFMAGMPLMAVASWITDRRSGRSEFARRTKQYEGLLRRVEDEACGCQTAGVAWRHERDPAPTLLVDRALTTSPDLWQRRAPDPDFLSVRIGVADQPSLVCVRPAQGGDEMLAARAAELAGRFVTDPAVPAVVSLPEAGVVGVVGARELLDETARRLAVQIAILHSPREVALAVLAPSSGTTWDWVKWLPHVEALRPGHILVSTTDETTQSVFAELRDLVTERRAQREALISSTATAFLPQVVVLVQPPLRLLAREVAAFLEEAGAAGVSVLWFAEGRTALPGQVRVVIEEEPDGVVITQLAGGHQTRRIALDRLSREEATAVALALAPLRDSTREDAAGSIPERVDLVDLLVPTPLDEQAVVERWEHAPPSLAAPLGAGSAGTFYVDMLKDGPHGLVAGTTGSGKSELLQTLVASLAATYPPTRVNFVLIDYKGGAAFKDCVGLPHTVGFVTDLDERLAERAIVSLNAELRRRERVLASGGHKDLADMRKKEPAAAPPNLLIIVDEFAALKNEVPVFIDGIVDIAQRGRSLGVHLLLATQKPRGIISANIQANTNLRISLRVTDADESTDVLGRPDAARLSRHQPGRAFVKTGATEVSEVQVAYVGSTGKRQAEAPSARTFRLPQALARVARERPAVSGPTHLAQMVTAATAASTALGIDVQRRPWLPRLPDELQLSDLAIPTNLEAPDTILGLIDAPDRQAQPPFVLDLAHAGSAVVFGAAGSGKTTILRTLAASMSRTYSPEQVHLYGLDFAGRGLAPLNRLPHCGDVVYGEDLDRVRRLISILGSASETRRLLLAEVGASSAAEYRRMTGNAMPAIVTLVDGFAQVWDALEPLDRGVHFVALLRVIAEGRSVGLHFVLTADRRGALPSQLSSTVARRILLRMATADEYASLGLKIPPGFDKAPAGRGWTESGELQIAAHGDCGDCSGPAQTRALAALAEGLGEFPPEMLPVAVRLLPEAVSLSSLDAVRPGDREIPIGLDEQNLEAAVVDFERSACFLVVGPPASGRTTALRTLFVGLMQAFPRLEAYLIGTRRSALYDEPWWTATARTATEVEALAAQVVEALTRRETAPHTFSPLLVVLDDADSLTEGRVATALDAVVSRARDANAIVLAGMSTYRANRAFSGWAQAIRQLRSGFILQPDDEADGDVFQVRLPRRAEMALPAGRGYLVQGNSVRLVQIAT